MILWITRDKNNAELVLHKKKPFYCKEYECWIGGEPIGVLSNYNFPEVTFENSPQQVELSLLGKLENKPILANYTLAESKAMIGGLSEKYCKEVPKEYYSEIEVKKEDQ